MARAVKWQMNFSSVNKNQYVVKIYEDGYSDTPIPLIGASSPFYTEEEEDEDIFIPIRLQTGCMTLIADENTEALMPVDNYSHLVTLESNSLIVWQGFIIPQALSQPWDSKPYEVEFQIQSPISLFSAKQMNMDKGLGNISLRDLIIEAFTECGISDLYNTIVIDNYMTSTVLITLLAFKVSRFNWFEVNKTEDDGTGDWQKFLGKSYSVMMKDVLSFLGLTMIERGKTLYLKAIDSWTYRYDKSQTSVLMISFTNFINKSGSWTMRTDEALSFDSVFSPVSTDNKLDIVPGLKKITITADINKIGDLINGIKTSNYDVIDQKTYYRNEWLNLVTDPSLARFFLKCRLHNSKSIENDIICFNYIYTNGNLVQTTYPTSVNIDALGVTIMDTDTYTDDDVSGGKDNYNYDSGLFCRLINVIRWYEGAIPSAGWDENVGFSISSQETASFVNGWLCLTANTQTLDGLCVERVNGLGCLTLGIRVGNKYWDGTAWRSYPCTFYAKHGQRSSSNWYDVGSGEIFSTKTLAMDCNASGYMIPITEELSGDVEIRFMLSFAKIQATQDSSQYGDPRYITFKNISLEYFSPDTESYNSNVINTYAKIISRSFNGEKNLALNIATSQNNKDGYAILKNENIPATYLQYNTNNSVQWFRPEEFLLDRMTKHYQENSRYITIDALYPNNIVLTKKIKNKENIIFSPISEKHYWAENSCEYKLITINNL